MVETSTTVCEIKGLNPPGHRRQWRREDKRSSLLSKRLDYTKKSFLTFDVARNDILFCRFSCSNEFSFYQNLSSHFHQAWVRWIFAYSNIYNIITQTDWLTEWGTLRLQASEWACVHACFMLARVAMDKSWTNFSLQDEPWAEFSTIEVAACVILCTYGPV